MMPAAMKAPNAFGMPMTEVTDVFSLMSSGRKPPATIASARPWTARAEPTIHSAVIKSATATNRVGTPDVPASLVGGLKSCRTTSVSRNAASGSQNHVAVCVASPSGFVITLQRMAARRVASSAVKRRRPPDAIGLRHTQNSMAPAEARNSAYRLGVRCAK